MQLKPEVLRARAEAHGQGHLFAFYDSLHPTEQTNLLAEVAVVDFDLIDRLIAELIRKPHTAESGHLQPASIVQLPKTEAEKRAERDARAIGEEAFRAGRVGCFLVAGGQGTRLGFNGPKGAFRVGPITDRTLFQLHAEKILALRRRYNAQVPWLIMTSDANDADTRTFFTKHDYFGLGPESIKIFKQGNMPAVGKDGKILMDSKSSLALSPNGHGGSIKALFDSSSTTWLRQIGVDTLFYFQVDNVLVKIGDPIFIGYHIQQKSEMSSKACRKRDWKEKVGIFALRGGKLNVVEYSDLPEAKAKESGPDGQLKWWAGSIAIHVLDVGFVDRLNAGGFQLPYHLAEKAVPAIDQDGNTVLLKPGEKNGYKFETFVFDALAQAKQTVTIETRRDEDFSPVKNAEGEDSPATAERDMMELYARWLSAKGVKIPRGEGNALDCRIEVSALTSLEGEDLEKAPREVARGQDIAL